MEHPNNTGRLEYWGIGWYRKHFRISEDEKDLQFYLDIDGAMSFATVWLNGKFVGGWPYGYSSFRLDLTPHIKTGGDNVLVIRLDNPDKSSRWYPGGGIYRNVWLVKTDKIHVSHWGTYIATPEVSSSSATIDLKINIDNHTGDPANIMIKTEVFEQDRRGARSGKPVLSSQAQAISVTANTAVTETKLVLPKPKLWDLQNPNLYVAVTSILQNNKVLDRYETVFGIRTIRFDVDKGFFLNGNYTRINGVCNHHDLGALGTAVNIRAMERQIELLKEMGCNAIRTSHNPPAPELLDLCDRMGMLVMDETFDCWIGSKTPNDYSLLFADWHEKDTRALVRRDRNHPSIILWSIGNEVRELTLPDGGKVAALLTGIVHEEDLTRPVTIGSNNVNAGYNGFQKNVDVFGYNYKPGQYAKFHKENPAIPLIGSETSSCVSSRGEYFFPVVNDKNGGRANFQVSSYDLYAPGWASSPDVEFEGQDKNLHVSGEFVWTGFDYLGEPTPYNKDVTNVLNFTNPEEKAKMEKELKELGKIAPPSRSSYFGILDLCGFKKDRFYIYQARWKPDFPMAHILPHWNWPERLGLNVPVHVYTSGDEAELFLNGKSLGRKKKEQFQYRLRWDSVIYQPGELKVIAYKNNKKWAEDVVKTTGQASKILLTPDRSSITADGLDFSFVTVAITDNKGVMVPRSGNRVDFEISGPGEIVATDNGDATSHESFLTNSKKAYNGLCLVIIRAKEGQPGKIVLKARSEGLVAAETEIVSK